MHARADVHIHTKYSDRPSEWLLRRIGAPESFVEPRELYQRVRERGMDFVTISDHNCIDGALEIADLPGTFISCEVTTYFPEDQAKIHCLVLGITEAQFARIQELRENIYDFQQYCLSENIITSVAHVLFRVNERLTVAHFEKLLLLFNRFEQINGTRDPRAAKLVETILTNLTPELISELADRHNLDPSGPTPWLKQLTGGSDDHSGVYQASAFTQTPPAANVEEYLNHLRAGRHTPGGCSGNSLRLAHSLYQIAYDFYKSRFLTTTKGKRDLLGEMFRRMLEEPRTTTPSLGSTMFSFATQMFGAYRRANMNPTERMLIDECSQLFAAHNASNKDEQVPRPADDRRHFQLACRISAQLGYAFFREFVKHFQAGDLMESVQTLFSLGPVAVSIAPYLAAFHTQHKDESFCQAVAARFPSARHLQFKSNKKAWITDTLTDLNGVSRTIRTVAELAQQQGRELTVVTCLDPAPQVNFPLQNFKAVGSFAVPEYDAQLLSFPPLLEVIEYLEREQFAELIISTPGPLGLLALAAGRLLGLRLTGIYHTDFPRYVGSLTDDLNMEQLTRKYMLWFYGQMETVFAPSEAYRRELIEQGLDPRRLRLMRRGVDLNTFGPQWRDEQFWQRWQLPAGCKFLYVGRISKEKGLDRVLTAFSQLDQTAPSQLILVGDGPQFEELRARYRQQPNICFTGALHAEELSQAYASADVFVFPSTTDTFGNAVLEAQAAGLPAIVGNGGGPPELVQRHGSGLIVDLDQPGSMVQALQRLRDDKLFRADLAYRALQNARESSWQAVLDTLWSSRLNVLPLPLPSTFVDCPSPASLLT